MKASCIIPTFGRREDVIQTTLQSLLDLNEEFLENCGEVFLIDQNRVPLNLQKWFQELPVEIGHQLEYLPLSAHLPNIANKELFLSEYSQRPKTETPTIRKVKVFHFYGLSPSVTMAKNFAIERSSGGVLLFFDDDVIVKKKTVSLHMEKQTKVTQIGVLGGRETIDPPERGRSTFKNWIAKITETFIPFNSLEAKYKHDGQYVGRIHGNSFFFCQFDLPGANLVEVDTIRGCNGSLRREVYDRVQGFDENFQGTALREETDFCLRIRKAGYINYFLGDAAVIHRRQLGGCNNLAKSYNGLISKLECELYFQYKHFRQVSFFLFFIRLLPLALEALLWSWGMSFIFLLQFTYQFYKLQRDPFYRETYEGAMGFPVKGLVSPQ